MASYNGTDNSDYNPGGFTNYYGGDGNDVLTGGAVLTTTGNGLSAASPFLYTSFGPSGDNVMEGGVGDDGLYGGDGNDAIFGGDGDDSGVVLGFGGSFYVAGLRGGGGNDFVVGGRGADDIYGELGNDILIGGEGPDKFFFTTALSSTANLDIVKDFEKGIDDIVLSQAIFTGIGPTLEKKEFYVGKKAHDNNDRVGYNDKNGKMWWDGDGQGGDGKVFFADLDGGLKLKYTDVMMIA